MVQSKPDAWRWRRFSDVKCGLLSYIGHACFELTNLTVTINLTDWFFFNTELSLFQCRFSVFILHQSARTIFFNTNFSRFNIPCSYLTRRHTNFSRFVIPFRSSNFISLLIFPDFKCYSLILVKHRFRPILYHLFIFTSTLIFSDLIFLVIWLQRQFLQIS